MKCIRIVTRCMMQEVTQFLMCMSFLIYLVKLAHCAMYCYLTSVIIVGPPHQAVGNQAVDSKTHVDTYVGTLLWKGWHCRSCQQLIDRVIKTLSCENLSSLFHQSLSTTFNIFSALQVFPLNGTCLAFECSYSCHDD